MERVHSRLSIVLILVSIIFIHGCSESESTAPEPGENGWPSVDLALVAEGFTDPVHLTSAGDGSDRLFVIERPGIIKIVLDDGTVFPQPFLDISGRVLSGGERGLLSAAFPDEYENEGKFYVCYTRSGDGASVLSRFTVSAGDSNRADQGSEEVLLTVSQPEANHNGGQIAFGPDGYLYVGLGDGGGAGDPDGNGQNTETLLGCLLRIDVNTGGGPYDTPTDNPYYDTEGYAEEIWAYGLRNPWRFSFDRLTGDLYIADVGQGLWEEIDFQPASSPGGENYGWNIMEGSHCYDAGSCDESGLTRPVHEYSHALGCSVTGGFVYRGQGHSGLVGIYIFGDYCSGRIWGLRRPRGVWETEELYDSTLRISSFGEAENGEVYVVDINGGIYRIDEAASP